MLKKDVLFGFMTFVFCVDIMGQAARNELPGVWNVEYRRNCFFPYWRSVLLTHIHVIPHPDYAAADPKCRLNQNKQDNNSTDKGTSPTVPNHILSLGRKLHITSHPTSARSFGTAALKIIPQITINHPFRRLLGTTALTLLKVTKQT